MLNVLHAETSDFTLYSCCAPKEVWKAIVKWLHFHLRVCFLIIPCNTGMLIVWSLFFWHQSLYKDLQLSKSNTLFQSRCLYPQTSGCSNEEVHVAYSLWDQSSAGGVHGNFTSKFNRRSMGTPFCFFCELMTCLYFAHPGEHAYKCSSCSFSTMTISQLKEHSLKVHGKALTLPRPRIVNLAASHAHHTSKNHTPAEEVEDSNGKRCLRARI